MNRAALAAVVLLATPALGRAQPMPAGREHAQDRAELRQDRREVANDWRDVRWTEQLLARFDEARSRHARQALRGVEDDVVRTLDRELQEAKVEAMRSGREVARSAQEVQGERREVRYDAAAGDRRGLQDDRRDLRDDHRDLRDDRRDLRDDRRDLARVRAIRAEFGSLRGRTDRRSLDRKRGLVVELVEMSRAELREDRAEQHEDLRERREDGREQRERW
jgi:hypothetical protein